MQFCSSSILSDKRVENTVITIASITVAVALVKTTLALVKSKDGNEQLPIIPYKLPFVGSTFRYYANPLKFAKINTEKFGSVFRMHFHGAVTTVVGAKDAPEVFNNPDLSFIASKNRFFGGSFFEGSGKHTFPEKALINSIIKHLTPNLNKYSPRAFQQFLQEIDKQALDKQFTVPNLLPFIRRFVSKYSASAFVGVRMCQDENLIRAFEHAVADIGPEFKPGPSRVIFPWFNSFYTNYLFPKSDAVKKHRALIKNSLSKEIAKRASEQLQDDNVEDKNKAEDVLDYLLKKYPHEVDNDHLESLTTIILIMIFVGVHTTTETVNYLMYCLLKHPHYIEELRQEQEQVVSNEGIDYSGTDVVYTPAMYRSMVKLDSFIRECMRTRMAGIGLSHTNISNQDVVLKSGATIKPGHEVFVNAFHMHHDPENQSGLGNLEIFDGFRFVGKDKLAVRSGQDNVSFGMGKHACPGRWFAIHQVKGIVSYFIKNYDMTPKSEIRIMNSTFGNYVGRPIGKVQFTKI
ncbi:cytochrome P450 [Parasitella parasitica]|nr:cytochrome P450 [Parasitella parasitica]